MAMTMARPEPAARRVTILGSTGSIGCQTIDLIERHPDRFAVEALTARRNVERLAEQARRLRPAFVAIADPGLHNALKAALADTGIAVGAGPEAVVEAAERPADFVMAGIVGAAGLRPTLAAVRRGAVVGLANKECLVCAGALFNQEVRQHDATLLPVDSEHNAIFQVFDFARRDAVEKLVLTASGGPFRTASLAEMQAVTPAQAVAHPNWDMGAKISVDSATMMNKGLEIIEAHHLFDMPEPRIEAVIHPQSIIHSMVAYCDGSVLAQLGSPDMRTPIAYSLSWPERIAAPPRLDIGKMGSLTFETPDPERFPALHLAREALRAGGCAPTVLNAANEVAVHSFLDERIGFLDIARVVEGALAETPQTRLDSLEAVYAADQAARRTAEAIIARDFVAC
jgi:1-deoxy-D-xylulose-5-phosphate reductoisomerase